MRRNEKRNGRPPLGKVDTTTTITQLQTNDTLIKLYSYHVAELVQSDESEPDTHTRAQGILLFSLQTASTRYREQHICLDLNGWPFHVICSNSKQCPHMFSSWSENRAQTRSSIDSLALDIYNGRKFYYILGASADWAKSCCCWCFVSLFLSPYNTIAILWKAFCVAPWMRNNNRYVCVSSETFLLRFVCFWFMYIKNILLLFSSSPAFP